MSSDDTLPCVLVVNFKNQIKRHTDLKVHLTNDLWDLKFCLPCKMIKKI